MSESVVKHWDCPVVGCTSFKLKWSDDSKDRKTFEELLQEMQAHVPICEKIQKQISESPEEKARLERVAQRAKEEETESGNFLCQCHICSTGTCKSGWINVKGAYRSRGHVQRHGEYDKFVHGN